MPDAFDAIKRIINDDASLRPRPGESAEQTVDRAVEAAQADPEIIEAEPGSSTLVEGDLIGFQTGRGPSGKLRNFKAMNDGKFMDTCDAVRAENNDPEAIAALQAESEARGMGGG